MGVLKDPANKFGEHLVFGVVKNSARADSMLEGSLREVHNIV